MVINDCKRVYAYELSVPGAFSQENHSLPLTQDAQDGLKVCLKVYFEPTRASRHQAVFTPTHSSP